MWPKLYFEDGLFLSLKFVCFSVVSLCDFGVRMCSVRHRPKDFSANFGSKLCNYLGCDNRERGSMQTVTKCDKGNGGQWSGFLRWHTFLLPPLYLKLIYFIVYSTWRTTQLRLETARKVFIAWNQKLRYLFCWFIWLDNYS